jgi:small GTP-binding protein
MTTETFVIDGQSVHVSLHDTAGQERFRSLTQNYCREADGAFLVFDVTRDDSLPRLESWAKFARGSWPEIDILVVATQCDKSPWSISDQGMKFAQRECLAYVETSAVTVTKEDFENWIRGLLDRIPPPMVTEPRPALRGNEQKPKRRC